MHYLIDARLENGVPKVTIRDADTGRVRLHWTRPGDRAGSQALHGLFNDLVLLSCVDHFDSPEEAQRTQSCHHERFGGGKCVSCATIEAAPPSSADHVASLTPWRRPFKPRGKQ